MTSRITAPAIRVTLKPTSSSTVAKRPFIS
jgi:hypothetical protein